MNRQHEAVAKQRKRAARYRAGSNSFGESSQGFEFMKLRLPSFARALHPVRRSHAAITTSREYIDSFESVSNRNSCSKQGSFNTLADVNAMWHSFW